MSEEKGIAVYRAGNQAEGNFVKGLLRERGIPVSFHPFSTHPDSEVDLYVPTADADRAQVIVRAYEEQTDPSDSSSEDWLCTRCGEENESSFDACWNCQAAPGHS